MAERPFPPQPTGGTPCDWGGCETASAGWRWVRAMRQWLPVCNPHNGGARARKYDDWVPDWAVVDRAGAKHG